MTKKEFEQLAPGTKVWLYYPYLTFPWVGIIKQEDGHNVVFVNFWGYGRGIFHGNDNEPIYNDIKLFDEENPNP